MSCHLIYATDQAQPINPSESNLKKMTVPPTRKAVVKKKGSPPAMRQSNQSKANKKAI